MKRLLFTLLIATLLSGCAATTIKKDYNLNESSNKGLLVTSISYQGGYSGYAVYFSDANSDKFDYVEFGAGVSLIPIPPKGDFSHLNRKGEVFATELPAGEYHIWRWRVQSGYATLTPIHPMKVEFKIEPGKATYIGNFDFIQTSSLGLTVTGVDVNYTDQSEIDLDVLFKKFPNIKREQVIKGIKEGATYSGIGGSSQTSWNIPIFL